MLDEGIIFPCEECDFKGKTKSYLRAHIKYKHERNTRFPCNQCDYKSKYKSDLKTHRGILN